MSEKDDFKRSEQARDLFLAALQVDDADRLEFLNKNCDGDKSLLDEVRSLLEHANLEQDPLEKGLDSSELVQEANGPEGQGLQLRCPKCSSTIDLNDDDDLTSVQCSSCKSSLNVLDDKVNQDSQSENVVDRKIGRYRLLEEIGAGAGGTVWLAQDEELKRRVAIKFPHKTRLGVADRERFLREARAAGRFRHANIVGVYEIGWDQGALFIVSEFVDGNSLKQWSQENQPNIRQVVAIVKTLADTLHYAHEHGVIHRDLKPQNVLMDKDRNPHIADFGLAKSDSDEFTMTVEGQLMGTPAYMSPEQATGGGHNLDRRGDVYSLGVILYELLTGECPFRGTTEMLIKQVVQDEPLEPRRLNSRVSRDLNTVCLKCLQKDPGSRYQTAEELAIDLDSIQKGTAVRARPVTQLEKGLRWCRRNPLSASLGTGLLFLLVTLSIVGPIIAYRQSNLATAAKTSADLAKTESKASKAAKAVAESKQLEAEKNARTATARRLARESELTYQSKPFQSALLAAEAASLKSRNDETVPPEVMSALHHASLNLGALHPMRFWGPFCFSSDGKFMYVAESHGIFRWDLTNDDPIETRQQITPKLVSVTSLSLSENGRFLYVLSGYKKGLARLDLKADEPAKSAQLVKEFGKGKSFKMKSDPKGKLIAVSDGESITIYKADHPLSSPLEIKGHAGNITEFVLSPDGRWLVTTAEDKTVKAWDLTEKNAELSSRILLDGSRTRLLTMSPDSRWVAWTADYTLFVADLSNPTADGAIIRLKFESVERVSAKRIAFGRFFVVASCSDGNTRVWQLDKEDPQKSLSILKDNGVVGGVATTWNGRWIMTVERKAGLIRVWQGALSQKPRKPKIVLNHYYNEWFVSTSNADHELIWSPKRDWIVLTTLDSCFGIWQVGRFGQLSAPNILQTHQDKILSLTFAENGKTLYSSSPSELGIWKMDQPKPNLSVRKAFILGRFFSGPQKEIYIRHEKGLSEIYFQPSSVNKRQLVKIGDPSLHTVLSPNKKWCFVGTADGNINRFVKTKDEFEQDSILAGHSGKITCLAISRDSRWLASGSRDKSVRLWDLESKNISSSSRVLRKFEKDVHELELSPDGRWVYVNGALLDRRTGGKVELKANFKPTLIARKPALFSDDGRWLLVGGVLCELANDPDRIRYFELDGIEREVGNLAFSPESKHLAVTDQSHNVRVWDLSSLNRSSEAKPRCITILSHPQEVICAAFQPNGGLLATGCKDSLVRVWDLNTERLIKTVKKRCRRELTEQERALFQIQ